MSGRYPGERTDLSCGECGAPMTLRTSVYGPFYGCSQYPECNGVHGAHPDGSPLGTPADAKTRSARSLAHAAFDRLWREAPRYRRLRVRGPARARLEQQIRHTARLQAYAWLATQLGIDAEQCHIGRFDVAQCEQVLQACRGVGPADVRDWYLTCQRGEHGN